MKANGKFLLEKRIVFVTENSDGKMLYRKMVFSVVDGEFVVD